MWETRVEIVIPETKSINLLYNSQKGPSLNKSLTRFQAIVFDQCSTEDLG